MTTIDELKEQLHEAGGSLAPPDLDAITARGRRMRRRRQVGRTVAAVAVVGFSGLLGTGAVAVLGGDTAEAPDAGAEGGDGFHDELLTAAEREVLESNPDARRVGNSVAVTSQVPPGKVIERHEIAGRAIAIGHHYMRSDEKGLVDANVPDPEHTYILEEAAFQGDGAESLLCGQGKDFEDPGQVGEDDDTHQCMLATAEEGPDGKLRDNLWYGSPSFRKPGAEMEAFIWPTFVGNQPGIWVFGGMDGTAATRVELTLADGSTAEAEVYHDIAPGDTIWTATLVRPVVTATAYNQGGEVLEKHEFEPCGGGVDCELR
ncbi:MAG: hypothetical protein GEU93_11675 [Propionibacteriales bacterium]|nr:hypothetical protein [Propionibacteriales bacterium]